MEPYLLTVINVVGVVQALFIAVALLLLPGRHAGANRMLALLMLTFALMFAYDVLYHNDLIYRFPIVVFLRLPLIFLYGPLFLLYLVRITRPSDVAAASTREWLHLLLFAGAALLYLQSIWLSAEELLQLLNYAQLRRRLGEGFQPNLLQQLLWHATVYMRMPLFAIQMGVCLLLGYRVMVAHAAQVKQHFSYTHNVSLGWVRSLFVFVVVLWVLVVLKEFVFPASSLARWLNHVTVVGQVLFVFLVGLFGLLQTAIFTAPAAPAVAELPHADAAPRRYQGSALSEPHMDALVARLQELMTTHKPWQESDLTLARLAAMLKVSSRHLSQVINARLGRNFLDFVNAYRIEEAQRLLADPANTSSILTIAMETGFNSKSAFYNAFRCHAGRTPTEYRQSTAVTPAFRL